MKKYCRLCKKKEHREECGFGPKMWDKYSVDDATNKEQEAAAKESGITNGMGESLEDAVLEANKSGDNSLRDWFSKSKSSDGKPGWVQLGGKYAGKPCARQPGQTTKPKCGSSKMKRNLSKSEEDAAFRRKNRQDPNPDRKGKAINVATEETKKDHEFSMARSELATIRNAAKRLDKKMGKKGEGELKAWVQSKITKAADYIDTAADYVTNEENTLDEKCWPGYEKKGMKTMFGKRYPNCVKKTKKEEVELTTEGKGEKDACYHKVKSRYKVWPSAYASGALVKCRKKGAANWGNSTKKESFEYSNWREDFKATEYEFTDVITPDPLEPTKGIGSEMLEMEEAVRVPQKTGQVVRVFLTFRGKMYVIQMFFPSVKLPSRSDIQDQIDKVYPGGKVRSYNVSDYKPGEPVFHTEDWQKKSGKNPEGGLNEKGRKSYERQNPGSDLKRPSKKVGNKRRASFCARMKGMKKKLTSAKTANDPDSRINKSLRAWNC
tara:strand:- start:420 stop:1895 length:1476 start_codon:yes stop_codon:yes gene_type:complete